MEEVRNELCEKFSSYYSDLVRFYLEYFPNRAALDNFLESILFCTKSPNIPRLMLNNTMRLANLALDMEIIRPGKDALKIIYLITCMETLYKLADKQVDRNGVKINKILIVIDFLEVYFSDEDKNNILSKAKRSIADNKFEGGDYYNNNDITIEIFARILDRTRNIFLHEGDYWSYSLCSSDYPETRVMGIVESHKSQEMERIYEFELRYEELHQMCLRAFINFIKEYINNKDKQ